MKLYCNLEGVLVPRLKRDSFDKLQWATDGKELWNYIKTFEPTILSDLLPGNFYQGSVKQKEWCASELGIGVKVIVVSARAFESIKDAYSRPAAYLIDDNAEQHEGAWCARGGVFIRHYDAAGTIARLRFIFFKQAGFELEAL